jgi:hypothetical protein
MDFGFQSWDGLRQRSGSFAAGRVPSGVGFPLSSDTARGIGNVAVELVTGHDGLSVSLDRRPTALLDRRGVGLDGGSVNGNVKCGTHVCYSFVLVEAKSW